MEICPEVERARLSDLRPIYPETDLKHLGLLFYGGTVYRFIIFLSCDSVLRWWFTAYFGRGSCNINKYAYKTGSYDKHLINQHTILPVERKARMAMLSGTEKKEDPNTTNRPQVGQTHPLNFKARLHKKITINR